jgi:hypothetical protein
MKTNMHFCLFLPELFLEREMFQTSAVEKIETRFMPNNFFLRKIVPFIRYGGKML